MQKTTILNSFKKLASETAIYGVSSIVGRFLNWWLVPYYSHLFLPDEYGVVTNLYSYMAFLLVILTYGMETGYFRFASKSNNKELVYSTSVISLFVTSTLFLVLAFAFSGNIANSMGYANNPEYIRWIVLIMAFDAFTTIPFAKLRIEGRPIMFASLKIINIFTTIFLNIFFLSICPAIIKNNPDSFIQYIYNDSIGIGYVFISNLIASAIVLLMLVPHFVVKIQFKGKLLKEMIWYSFPILIVGVAGMVNQNIDKILIPKLIPEASAPMQQLGIYGANYKLAVLMNMFIQAFRYAFEPFFFSQTKNDNNKKGYALILKYFSIFGFLIFLAISLYLDAFKSLNIIDSSYYSGLKVVPIVLLANLFLGVYYTLSLWYKLTDKTKFGAYFAIIGAAISLFINIVFIPKFGYMASAYAVLISYAIMMICSYIVGQKYFPVNYPIKRVGMYFVLSMILFGISTLNSFKSPLIFYTLNTFLFVCFIVVVYKLEWKELKLYLKY